MFFLAAGKEVAFVDLTVPAKTPAPPISVIHTKGGGVLNATHRDPRTPTLSVRINGIWSYTDRATGAFKEEVEVVVTNTGKSVLSIPIGDDPNGLLYAPGPARDRRSLSFTVRAGEGALDSIAYSESAANSEDPASSARLAPGDTVVFRLPFNLFRAETKRRERNGPLEISVEVQLIQVAAEEGEVWNEDIGERVRSENTVLWP
jgi:hypothetical protein